jgi:hypothetical protein
MWINEMLTIWLYGSLFALALIGFSLVRWYAPEARGTAARTRTERDEGSE